MRVTHLAWPGVWYNWDWDQHTKHGGHLLLYPGGERDAGQDVAGRHRARHEPGVSRDTSQLQKYYNIIIIL